MKKEQAEQILGSRTVINMPGKYQAKVNNVILWNGRFIVNTNLMNMYLAKEAKEAFEAGEYQEACNTNLSVTVFINEETGEPRGYLPQKGEIINVMADYITTKDGERALMLQSCHEIKVTAPLGKFSFDSVEEEDAIEESTKKKKKFSTKG